MAKCTHPSLCFVHNQVYELLHQLTALPLGDGGLWPKNFAPSFTDWYHSRTMGQFRFVKVSGTLSLANLIGPPPCTHSDLYSLARPAGRGDS